MIVTDSVVFKDNFDSYANNAALYASWPQTSVQPDFNIVLSSLQAASCNYSVLEPAAGSGSPSRIYKNVGELDGTDDQPLTLRRGSTSSRHR